MNCITDLEVIINLDQINLIFLLLTQMQNLMSTVENEDLDVFETPNSCRQTGSSRGLKNNQSIRQAILESETDFAKDSGIDFDISSVNSNKNSVRIYFVIF